MKVWLLTFINSADEAPPVAAVDSAATNYLQCKEPPAFREMD